MSATERLRELLDKRGVEYDTDDEDGCEFTEWMANGLEWEADSRGELVYLTPAMLITPEQAIAATLGPEDAYTREDVEGAFVSGYSLGLDMFDCTKADANKGWNQNERDMDEEMAERGWVRVSNTDGASTDTDGHDSGHVRNVSTMPETCHLNRVSSFPSMFDARRCDNCWNMAVYDSKHEPKVCPYCGRLVVDE